MATPSFNSFTWTSAAPDAVVCGTIGQFVLVSLLSNEFTVQWCDIGNPLSWSTPLTAAARAAQAGSEELNPEYGYVTGITGGDFYGYVFQQKAVSKWTYVGGDVVWQIAYVDTGKGCIDYNRFTRVGDAVYFESEIGYHKISPAGIEDIGLFAVDDSYTPTSALSDAQKNVVANRSLDTVFFETFNLAFNYKTGQWTRQSGLSGAVYFPTDDPNEIVGQIKYSGTAVNVQTSKNGAVLNPTLQMGLVDVHEGGRTLITGVRPLTSGGTWTVRAGSKSNIGDSTSWTASTSVTSRTGIADFRKEGRYMTVEINGSAQFTTISGADVYFEPAGEL